MILIIDNYDSFVYNLERYILLAGMETSVIRNDVYTVEQCLGFDPAGIVLSPGPKSPKDAGICLPLLQALPLNIPVLGVCLGHQCLVERFGGRTSRAVEPLHGEATMITHNKECFFEGLPNPLPVGRYHSLISTLPDKDNGLKPIAFSQKNELMAVCHQTAPWYGVQFHPESVLTPDGKAMIEWFVRQCRMTKNCHNAHRGET